jgi:hypothetical protein
MFVLLNSLSIIDKFTVTEPVKNSRDDSLVLSDRRLLSKICITIKVIYNFRILHNNDQVVNATGNIITKKRKCPLYCREKVTEAA